MGAIACPGARAARSSTREKQGFPPPEHKPGRQRGQVSWERCPVKPERTRAAPHAEQGRSDLPGRLAVCVTGTLCTYQVTPYTAPVMLTVTCPGMLPDCTCTARR